jgi:hypothetical protein
MSDLQNEQQSESNSDKMEKLEGLLIDNVIKDIESSNMREASEHMELLITLLKTKADLLRVLGGQ